MLYSPREKSMSSLLAYVPNFTVSNLLHLIGIFLVAIILNRLLHSVADRIVEPASSQTRAAQAREQQTRTLAGVAYSACSAVVWAVALLTAVHEFGVNVLPVAVVAGLGSLAVGFGAQNLVRDVIGGFYIILEDQYAVGDTIQVGNTLGRVEHLTLRRTVVRDPRGALVTVSNGDMRTVGNLSRDWSQALVDGPRILGLQSFDHLASTIRLQVRTAPARQEDVARELRRRIQLEFQRQGIPSSNVQRVELVNRPALDDAKPPARSA